MLRLASLALLLGFIPACCASPPESYDRNMLLAPMFDDGSLPRAVEIPNFAILSPQVAGGGAVTPEQVASMPELGYTTIINLRTAGERGVAEEEAAARAAGLNYLHFPTTGSNYDLDLAQTVRQAISVQSGKVLLHCGSGARVAAVWAMVRAIDEGLPPEEAARVAAEEGPRPISTGMVDRVRDETRAGIPFPRP